MSKYKFNIIPCRTVPGAKPIPVIALFMHFNVQLAISNELPLN